MEAGDQLNNSDPPAVNADDDSSAPQEATESTPQVVEENSAAATGEVAEPANEVEGHMCDQVTQFVCLLNINYRAPFTLCFHVCSTNAPVLSRFPVGLGAEGPRTFLHWA